MTSSEIAPMHEQVQSISMEAAPRDQPRTQERKGDRRGTPTKSPAPKPRQSPMRPTSYAAAYAAASAAGRTRSPSPVVAKPFATRTASPNAHKAAPAVIKSAPEAPVSARRELTYVTSPPRQTASTRLSPRLGMEDVSVFISHQASPRNPLHHKLTIHPSSRSPSPRQPRLADPPPVADTEQSLDAQIAAALLAIAETAGLDTTNTNATGVPTGSPDTLPGLRTRGSPSSSPPPPVPGSVLHSVRSMLKEPTTPRAITALAQQLQMHSSSRALSTLAARTGHFSDEEVIAATLHRRLTGRHGGGGGGGGGVGGGSGRAVSRSRHTAGVMMAGDTKLQGRTGSYAGMPRPTLFLDLPASSTNPFDHTLTTVRAGRQDSPRTAHSIHGTPRVPGSTSAPGHSLLPYAFAPGSTGYTSSPPRPGHSREATASARVTDTTTNYLTTPTTDPPLTATALSAPAATVSPSGTQPPRVEVVLPLVVPLPSTDTITGPHAPGQPLAPESATNPKTRQISCGSGASQSSGGSSSVSSNGGTRQRRSRNGRRKVKKPPPPWYACLLCGLLDSPVSTASSPRKAPPSSVKKPPVTAAPASPEPSPMPAALPGVSPVVVADVTASVAAAVRTPSPSKATLWGGITSPLNRTPSPHRHSGNDDTVILQTPNASHNGSPIQPRTDTPPNHPNHQLPEQELAEQLPTPEQLRQLPLAEMLQALQGVLLNAAGPAAVGGGAGVMGTGSPYMHSPGMAGADGQPGVSQSAAIRSLSWMLRPLPQSASPFAMSPAAARKGAALRQIVGGGVAKRRSRSRSTTGLPPRNSMGKRTQAEGATVDPTTPASPGHPVHVVDGKAFALPSWLIHSPRMLSYLPPWERTLNSGASAWSASRVTPLPTSPRTQSPFNQPVTNRTPSPLRTRSDLPLGRNASPTWRPGGSPCPRGAYYDLQAEGKRQGKDNAALWASVGSLASVTSSAQWSALGHPQGTPPRATGAVVIPTSAPAKLRARLAPSPPRALQPASPGKRSTASMSRSPPRTVPGQKPPLAPATLDSHSRGSPSPSGRVSAGKIAQQDTGDLVLHQFGVLNRTNSPGRVAAMPAMSLPTFPTTATITNALWSRSDAASSGASLDVAPVDMTSEDTHGRNESTPDILQPTTTLITLSHLINQAMTEAQKLAKGVSTVANQHPTDNTTATPEADLDAADPKANATNPTDPTDATTILTDSRRCTVEVYASSVAEDFSSVPQTVHFVTHTPHWQFDPSISHLQDPKKLPITLPTTLPTASQLDNPTAPLAPAPAPAQLTGMVADSTALAGDSTTTTTACAGGAQQTAAAPTPGLLSRITKVGSLTRMVFDQLRSAPHAEDVAVVPPVPGMVAAAPGSGVLTEVQIPAQAQHQQMEAHEEVAAQGLNGTATGTGAGTGSGSGRSSGDNITHGEGMTMGGVEGLISHGEGMAMGGVGGVLAPRRSSGAGMMGSIKRFIMRNGGTNNNNNTAGSGGDAMAGAVPMCGGGGDVRVGGSSGGGSRGGGFGVFGRPRQQTNESMVSSHELLPCPPSMPHGNSNDTLQRGRVTLPSGTVPRATASLQWEDLESVGDRRSLVMDVRASASESVTLAPPRDLASAGGHSMGTSSSLGGGGASGGGGGASGSGGGSGSQVLERVHEEPSGMLDDDQLITTNSTTNSTRSASHSKWAAGPPTISSPDVSSRPRTPEDRSLSVAVGGTDTPTASQRFAQGQGSPAANSVTSRSRAVTPTPAGMASPLRTASRAASSHLLRAALDPLATGIPCDWSSASLLQYEATLSNVQALLNQQEEH